MLNIAGITSPVPFLETTVELWNRIFAVNVTGTYLVTKAFLPEMIDGGYGRVLNMSSVSAQQGGGVFGKTPYSSAKAAVLGLHQGAGPGTRPDRHHRERAHPGRGGHRHPGARHHPGDRGGHRAERSRWAGRPRVDDVTALFAFLASEEAGYLTGTTQNVNGGSYFS